MPRAAELADQALERYRRLGYIRGVISNLHISANIARDRGDDTTALQRYQESLDLAHMHDDHHQVLGLLESIARIAATKRHFELAIHHYAVAATLREHTGYRVRDPTESHAVRLGVATVRSAAGDRLFEEAWTAGCNLTPNQVIAEALAFALPAKDLLQASASDLQPS